MCACACPHSNLIHKLIYLETMSLTKDRDYGEVNYQTMGEERFDSVINDTMRDEGDRHFGELQVTELENVRPV